MRKLFNKYISIPLIICATINLFSCSEDYTVVRISRPEIKDTIYDTTLFKLTLSARVEKFKTPGRPDLDG